MEFRRFIDSEDLGALDEDNDLRVAIEYMLELIVFPEFKALSYDNKFYLDDIKNFEGNNLLFYCRITGLSIEVKPNEDAESYDFIEKYIAIKDNAMYNIIEKTTPVVKENYLHGGSLSSNQFIIKFINIKFIPNVRFYIDGSYIPEENYYGYLTGEVDIRIILNIEDISGLEPGQIQALQIKYNNLCSSYTVQSINELQQWAKQLGLPNYGTKQDLCLAIKTYYGF